MQQSGGITTNQMEQLILGCILMDPASIFRVVNILDDKMFSKDEHQTIYGEMLKIHARGGTITKLNIAHGLGEKIGDQTTDPYLEAIAYAAGLEDYLPVEEYAEHICEIWQRDELKKVLEKNLKKIGKHDHPIDEMLADLVSFSEKSLVGNAMNNPSVLSESMSTHLENIAAAYQRGEGVGYDTGLESINQLTGPWCNGQYIIIGAKSKVGKSALAMQTACGLARFGHVLYFSFEMKDSLLAARELARHTGVASMRQRLGKVSEAEYAQLSSTATEMSAITRNIHIVSEKLSATQILDKARLFKKQHDLKAVYVDHLGILRPERGARTRSDWEIAATASPVLEELASELDVIAVGLSQLNKDNPNFGQKNIKDKIRECFRRPTSNDLKGSIANDADHVIMPFRPEALLLQIEPQKETEEYHEWEDARNRQRGRAQIGLTLSRESDWPKWVDVKWNGQRTSFEDIQDAAPDFGVF